MSYDKDEQQPEVEEQTPDHRKITTRQAMHLADLSGADAKQLVGRPIFEIERELKWKIDPQLFAFRKVCGRVVRNNPATGQLEGVPNATVQVEDTDCSFLGYFPVEGPWSKLWWFWPTFCDREVIATVRTDRCGNFCVWIPRWDIDRLLSWRRQRQCYPIIRKPNLADILTQVPDLTVGPIPGDPNPPDPPFAIKRNVLRQVGELVGRPEIERLAEFSERPAFGKPVGELQALLEAPAFVAPQPAPLSDDAIGRLEGVHVAIDDRLDLRPSLAIGPFMRCQDVFVPEWQTIVDVPDITFRVTQDVDFDGDEEEIYSESYFDVRWNAGPIADVTLVAAPFAISTPTCDIPVIPCGNNPRIGTVGLMPLANTHHDDGSGHAIKVNQPHSNGFEVGPRVAPGQAPYAGTLQLHGCYAIGGAKFYRVLYRYEGNNEVAFTGSEWDLATKTGPPWVVHVAPDAAGWYEVPDQAHLTNLWQPNLLFNWPTRNGPNGHYRVRLELADINHQTLAAPTGFSDEVRFTIDNSSPLASINQIRWRVAPNGPWLPENTYTVPYDCLVFERPTHTDIEIEFTWGVSATHLRDLKLGVAGCGVSGQPTLLGGLDLREHWHTGPGDNSYARTTLCSLPGTQAQGAYSVSLSAYSRAFNPAGDGGGLATDWLADYPYIWVNNGVAFAVVDA